VARRIALASEPHGLAFGSGFVWVALYHQSTIVRVDPDTNRILGPPISAGFPTEPLALAGGHLWAIPSVGGSLADPQRHTVLEIDAPKRPHPGLLPQPRPPPGSGGGR
jgi:DNA-binding beta-propeller fold protein YncE